jgi:SagB-type dehydrogenase family enzyme
MERQLPPPRLDLPFPLVRSIAARRSVRQFSSEPISSSDLGLLLWSCQGVTEPREGFRAAPSAGGVLSFEIQAILAEGVFRYLPKEHSLQSVAERDIRPALARAALDQQFLATAPLTLGISADLRPLARRYGERGRRYMYMEAGHIAENLLLSAVALGYGSVLVGAFDDTAVGRLLDLASGFEPLYLVPVGKPLGKSA